MDNRWYVPGQGATFIGPNWAHPGENYDSMRVYVHPTTGYFYVYGDYWNHDPNGYSDGVLVKFYLADASGNKICKFFEDYVGDEQRKGVYGGQGKSPRLYTYDLNCNLTIDPGEDRNDNPYGQLVIALNKYGNTLYDTTQFLGNQYAPYFYIQAFAEDNQPPYITNDWWNPTQIGGEGPFCGQSWHYSKTVDFHSSAYWENGRFVRELHTVTFPRIWSQCGLGLSKRLEALELHQTIKLVDENPYIQVDYKFKYNHTVSGLHYIDIRNDGHKEKSEVPALYVVFSPNGDGWEHLYHEDENGNLVDYYDEIKTCSNWPHGCWKVFPPPKDGWSSIADETDPSSSYGDYGITLIHKDQGYPLSPVEWGIRNDSITGGGWFLYAAPQIGSWAYATEYDGNGHSWRVADWSGRVFIYLGTVQDAKAFAQSLP